MNKLFEEMMTMMVILQAQINQRELGIILEIMTTGLIKEIVMITILTILIGKMN